MGNSTKKRALNLNKTGCTPMSSNCVIWQGPDIPFLNLCKGDTVTDVVYELAMEFWDLYKQFDVANYNIDCLKLTGCEPETFKDLFQQLINKLCTLLNSDGFGGCNLVATISHTTGDHYTVAVANGTGPYTYSWTVAQFGFNSLTIDSGAATDTIMVAYGTPVITVDTGTINMGLLRVQVTDVNGCTATDHFLATDITVTP